MDVKEILFAIILIIAISTPFFFKKQGINVSNKINLPEIEVKKGSFKKFTTNLEESGNFTKIDYINKKNYSVYNLFMNITDKNADLKSKKVEFANNLYNFYNLYYITEDYIYNSNRAIYNPKTKVALSYYFTFFNKKISGKGKKMLYKDDIITAQNIDYKIKGFKW